jgi:hypothetical protein
LPGKVTGIEIVVGALSRVREGKSFAVAARAVGVCELTARHWLVGVAARCLDLYGLLRHRAIITSGTSPATLVRFAAFVTEIARRRPVKVPAGDARSTEHSERTAAMWRLLDLVEELGGTLATTQLGAALFRQAVLLFRSTPIDTSNCDALPVGGADTLAARIGASGRRAAFRRSRSRASG